MANSNVRLRLGLISICFAFASPTFSQQPQVADDRNLAVPVVNLVFEAAANGIQPDDFVAQRVSGLEKHLDSVISEIARACDLTPKQKKKLHVASKGATEDLRKMMQPVEQEASAEQRLLFDGPIYRVQIPHDDGRRTAAELDAAVSPIWQSAFQTVLTAEQKEAYVKSTESRFKYRRRACASSSVAKLDTHLLLTAEQRDRIEEQIYDYLVKHDNFDLPGIANIAMVVAPVAKDILSEPQQERFKEIQAGRFDDVSEIQGQRIQQFQRLVPMLKQKR